MRTDNSERAEEMLLQIRDVFKLYNNPLPYISAEEAIQRIREIIREEGGDDE